MKKVILSLMIILVAITMIGCNNKSTKAMTNLKNEIDSTEQTVFSSYVREVSDISNPAYFSNTASDEFRYHKQLIYENLSREEELRQQVITMSSFLKSKYDESLKLSKNQIYNAKMLTSNLKKYNEQLRNTKNDVSSFSNCIKNSIKDTSIDYDNANLCFVTLNNSLNERYMCLCNIYNDLEEIYMLFFENIENNPPPVIEENKPEILEESYKKVENNEEIKKDEKGLKKNIDSYNPYRNINNDTNQQQKEIPYNNRNYPQNENNYNPVYNNYPINNNLPYNQNYNNFINQRYSPYGYNFYNINRFNPNRNTDTFYSFNRNIDTYRFSPSFYKNQTLYNFPNNEILTTSNYEKDYNYTSNQNDDNTSNNEEQKKPSVINIETENNEYVCDDLKIIDRKEIV